MRPMSKFPPAMLKALQRIVSGDLRVDDMVIVFTVEAGGAMATQYYTNIERLDQNLGLLEITKHNIISDCHAGGGPNA